jgi:hypothetical protein
VEEQQELAALFGEEAFKLVGDLAESQYKKAAQANDTEEMDRWDDGGAYKIALHSVVGGIMSELGGSNFTSGAASAGLNEIVAKHLKKINDASAHQWISAIIGAAAAKVVGGNVQSGASTAASGTKNNLDVHFLVKEPLDVTIKEVVKNDEKAAQIIAAIDSALTPNDDNPVTAGGELTIREILAEYEIEGTKADAIIDCYYIEAGEVLEKLKADSKLGIDASFDMAGLVLVAGEVRLAGKITYDTYRFYVERAKIQGLGKITGHIEGLKPAERLVVRELSVKGKNVEIIPKDPKSIDKTPDFFVNGVKTELKTLYNANTTTGAGRVQQGFKQGAETVIIDARSSGLTAQQAQEIINRAAGTYPNKTLPGKVEIWINGQVITNS